MHFGGTEIAIDRIAAELGQRRFVQIAIDGRISRGDNLAVRSVAWVDQKAAKLVAPLLRIGVAIYFATIVLYSYGSPIILTAELKTNATWVPVLQLAIAATVLARRSAMPSWDGRADAIGTIFAEVTVEKQDVDILSARVVHQPTRFGVVVASELFRDIRTSLNLNRVSHCAIKSAT